MSNKVIKKTLTKSPATKQTAGAHKLQLKPPSPKASAKPQSPKQKKKKCVKNTFDLVQCKKMIGKGLIVVYKGSVALPGQDIKEKILSGNIKSIAVTGFVSSGILYIYNGVERLLAIHSVSYAEIKKNNLDIDVIVNQYSRLEPTDIDT